MVTSNSQRRQVPSEVPPGAQPGMTPMVGDVNALPTPPPNPAAAWQPAPAEPTGTELDKLMDLMDPMMWQTFLAIVTYMQMVDDMHHGAAKLSMESHGSVLSPFIGFGPAHVWKALEPDLRPTLLRTMNRWLKDPKKRAESSLTWMVLDQITPGLCLMTKGQVAHDESLAVLEQIRAEFA